MDAQAEQRSKTEASEVPASCEEAFVGTAGGRQLGEITERAVQPHTSQENTAVVSAGQGSWHGRRHGLKERRLGRVGDGASCSREEARLCL